MGFSQIDWLVTHCLSLVWCKVEPECSQLQVFLISGKLNQRLNVMLSVSKHQFNVVFPNVSSVQILNVGIYYFIGLFFGIDRYYRVQMSTEKSELLCLHCLPLLPPGLLMSLQRGDAHFFQMQKALTVGGSKSSYVPRKVKAANNVNSADKKQDWVYYSDHTVAFSYLFNCIKGWNDVTCFCLLGTRRSFDVLVYLKTCGLKSRVNSVIS